MEKFISKGDNQAMKIFDLINDMSNISRWSQVHCNRNESVLEHTAFVAIYSLYLGCKYSRQVDLKFVMKAALVHDMDEVVTGDIPRPTKYYNAETREMFEQQEREAMAKIDTQIFGGYVYSSWLHAKGNTPSGSVAALADCAACIYKMWQECMSGNKGLLKFKENIEISLREIGARENAVFLDTEIEQLKAILSSLEDL